MSEPKPEDSLISEDYASDAFTLTLSGDEARRQAWTGAGLCALILAALLTATVAGTA